MKHTLFNLHNADIQLFEDVFEPGESLYLYEQLRDKTAWQQDKITIAGNQINLPRLTAWYGEKDKTYVYSGIKNVPLEWTAELIMINNKINEIVPPEIYFNSVLLNYYRSGKDSIGWHSDDERELGIEPCIASVSFGESRVFQLKPKYDKTAPIIEIELKHNSLLIMQGKTQHHWLHQIPKIKDKEISPRINLTFRNIK